MKALIKVGYACNDHCTFCHTLEVRHIDGSSAEVHRKIERAAELGHSMVVLSGGEPTIRPELFEWAAHVAQLGMDFGLVTNGRLLSYRDVVEKLIASRLRYVYLSLHGGTAKIHNLMVRADAFAETYGALAQLTGRGLDLSANAVITLHNLDHLPSIVDAVLPYPDVTLKFSMVQPKGGGDRHFAALTPRVSDVAARVREAIAHGEAEVTRRGAAGPRFAHDGIPLCLLPGLEERYDDLKTHGYATMVEVGEGDFFPVDDRDKIQPDESCKGCALRGPCPGLYRGYHESFGAAELKPRTAPVENVRSNSYHYVLEQLSPWSGEGECALLTGGVTPWDRARHLFVHHPGNGRLARFRTRTRDFADVELDEIKHGLGQVYLDVSSKPAPDDFARDLVPLRRSARCQPCGERDRCTGLYEPLLEDLFLRDDARVVTLLAGITGDVLDVGCGEGPAHYDAALARLAEGRAIQYVGLDPDAALLARLAARRPWAELRQGGAEGLDDVAAFDHVLLLRSWNHLAEPATAVPRLLRALRPGGTLLLVDNVAFGLARTARQAARAETGPARFEHHRNDGASEAHRRVTTAEGGASLELLERRDVDRTSSNQWLLRYRKELHS